MSRYKSDFTFAVAFPPQAMSNVLAEWLAKEGIRQAHIAGVCFLLSCYFDLFSSLEELAEGPDRRN